MYNRVLTKRDTPMIDLTTRPEPEYDAFCEIVEVAANIMLASASRMLALGCKRPTIDTISYATMLYLTHPEYELEDFKDSLDRRLENISRVSNIIEITPAANKLRARQIWRDELDYK